MVSLVDARSPSGLDFPLFAKYTKYHTTIITITTIPYHCHTRPPTYFTQGSTTKHTKQTSSFLDCLFYYSPVVQNKILAQNLSTNSKIYKQDSLCIKMPVVIWLCHSTVGNTLLQQSKSVWGEAGEQSIPRKTGGIWLHTTVPSLSQRAHLPYHTCFPQTREHVNKSMSTQTRNILSCTHFVSSQAHDLSVKMRSKAFIWLFYHHRPPSPPLITTTTTTTTLA